MVFRPQWGGELKISRKSSFLGEQNKPLVCYIKQKQ